MGLSRLRGKVKVEKRAPEQSRPGEHPADDADDFDDDRLDQELEDTFPASDPLSFWPGEEHRPAQGFPHSRTDS